MAKKTARKTPLQREGNASEEEIRSPLVLPPSFYSRFSTTTPTPYPQIPPPVVPVTDYVEPKGTSAVEAIKPGRGLGPFPPREPEEGVPFRDYAKYIPGEILKSSQDAFRAAGEGASQTKGSFTQLAQFFTGQEVDPVERRFGDRTTVLGHIIEPVANIASAAVLTLGFGLLPQSARAATSVVSGISQLTRWGAKSKFRRAVELPRGRRLGGLVRGRAAAVLQGPLIDATAFPAEAENLSDFFQDHMPQLAQNIITDYLASDPGDTFAEAKLKTVLDGMAGGAVAAEILNLLSILKRVRHADKVSPEEAANKIAELAPEMGNISQRLQRLLPSADQVRARAYALWEKAGKPEGQDGIFWREAEAQLTKEFEVKQGGISRVSEKAGPPPITARPDVVLTPEQKARLRANLERAMDEKPSGFSDHLEEAWDGEGTHFNLEKMDTNQRVMQGIEDVAEVIPPHLADWTRRETHEEVALGARILGMNPERVKAGLAADAAEAELRTKRFIAAKRILQAKVYELKVWASNRPFLKGKVDELAAHQKRWGELMNEVATIYANLLAVRTSSARVVSAGRIRTAMGDTVMTVADLENMTEDQLELFANVLHLTDGPADAMRIMKRGWIGKAFGVNLEYWMNSILSGPGTHALNVASTAAKTMLIPGEKAVGGVLGGDPRAVREGLMTYYYMVSSFSDAMRAASKAFMTDRPQLSATHALLRRRAQISGESLGISPEWPILANLIDYAGSRIRLPFRLLTAEDELFKHITYSSVVKARAYQAGLDKGLVGPDLAQYVRKIHDDAFDMAGRGLDPYAVGEAAEGTFQRTLPPGGFANSYLRMAYEHPALRQATPFVRTPTNLFSDSVQRSPLWFLSKRLWGDLRSPNDSVRASARGRLATAQALSVLAGWLAWTGRFTGSAPGNKAQREAWGMSGKRPHSLVFGLDGPEEDRQYVRLQMDPFTPVISIITDFVNMSGEMDDATLDEYATAIVSSIAENLTSKVYLRGLSDFLGAAMKPDRDLKHWARRFMASYVPSGLRALAQKGDPDGPRVIRNALDTVWARLPGFSSDLPPQRNALGEVSLRPAGYGINTIWPFYSSKGIKGPTRAEMARMVHGFQLPTQHVGGQDWSRFNHPTSGQRADDYYAEQIGKVRDSDGRTLIQVLDDVVTQDWYRNLPEYIPSQFGKSARVDVIKTVLAGFRLRSQEKTERTIPELGAYMRAHRQAKKVVPYVGVEGAEELGYKLPEGLLK